MRTQTKTRPREYLVLLESYGRKRTVVWKGKDALPLDHPVTWYLEHAPQGVQARQVATARGRLSPHHLVPVSENGRATALVPQDGHHESQARIRVTVKKLQRPKPAYSPPPVDRRHTSLGVEENYLFCGLGAHLFSYSRVGSKFKIHLEQKLLFEHQQDDEGRHAITVHQPGIVLESPETAPRELGQGLLHVFTAEEFHGSTLRWGNHWWRVNAIPVGDDLGIGRVTRHDGDRFRNLARSVGTVCFLLLVAGFVFLKPYPERKPRIEGVRVTLKAPKALPPETSAPAPVVPPEPVVAEQQQAPPPVTPPPSRLPPEFFRRRPLQPMTGRGPEDRQPAKRVEPEDDPEPIVKDVEPEAEPPPKPAKRPLKPINQALAKSGLQIRGAGRANKDAIGQTLERYLPYFQTCYRRALEKDPYLQGVVVVGWTIEPTGEASDVAIVQADLDNAGLIGCITQEMREIRFPPPRGGGVQVEYPIVFVKNL